MAHESFEDAVTAARMNADFVCVKVDREERPDVDAVYMTATQAMTGSGGWPMTVFATPDGEPFHCGTYFPPEPRHGMPGFRQVLEAVAQAWRERRKDVSDGARRISARLAEYATAPTAGELAGPPPSGAVLDAAVRLLAGEFDAARGGFGGAPKFPPSMVLEFLLRYVVRARAEGRDDDADAALRMASVTTEAMARGGLYDQLGGGFARYSTDADWVVPHFEKMLYDNALLLRVYLHLWRLTGDSFSRDVAQRTADFLLRELRTAEGGFASSLDADSEGVEGRYYAWTPEQLRVELGPDDGAWAAELFGVTADGTFEHGASVLQLRQDPDDRGRYLRVVDQLRAARERRVRPGRDDKVVAAWNGLAIAALAESGVLLERPDLVAAARAAARLLRDTHLVDGRLRRVSRDGVAGAPAGVLEDYGCCADGLLALHAATGEAEWLTAAGTLLDVVLAEFTDADGVLHDTASDAERLLFRPTDVADGATPSGTFAVANALLNLAAYTGSATYRTAAERALSIATPLAERAPRAAGWGLAAAEALLDGPRAVAVVGPANDERTAALHRLALAGTAPGLAVAFGVVDGGAFGDPSSELLRDRPLVAGQPTAYVCRGFVCDAPTTDPAVLAAAVGSRR